MEKALAEIENDIASLREHEAEYRGLAEQRRAHGHLPIAQKLESLTGDLEAKVSELEALKLRAAPYPINSEPRRTASVASTKSTISPTDQSV